MRYSLIASAVVWTGLAVSAAQAMPVGPSTFNTDNAPIVQVDYACGRGWHESWNGECRPNEWRRGPPPFWDRDRWAPHHHHHWDEYGGGDGDWGRPPPPRW
ncbi:GCG_CRPN prefix-to-repeats domain-containing protein [Rhizobium sp. K15/93]|uniref:GCG_CRPN prefix-to-repeats domain-containing protein n=2 Tax=unclassified Rhizobium TaxID=2613769 RepID=UPI0035A88D6B